MKSVTIIIDNINQDFSHNRNTPEWELIMSADKVVLIYIETQRWFPINDPQTICASINSLNSKKGIERRNIIALLKSLEFAVKINNKKAEVIKLILLGDEKYKITKCVSQLKTDLIIVFLPKKRNIFERIFSKTNGTLLVEELGIPVLTLKQAI
ncbi:universal Stress protein [Vairimorpha necatrix]|uniref:Universal Stress protein n=1 Tax=Vairimorpha necatrix TaxID=6039 RepID=A0AAX4JAI0_9MICR